MSGEQSLLSATASEGGGKRVRRGQGGLIVTSRRICANYSRYLIADVASETILVATRTYYCSPMGAWYTL